MPSLRSLLCLPSRAQSAEIDGGPLANHDLSVFLHIERGLRANPHGLAVISTHQPPDHLSSLIGSYNKGMNGTANHGLNGKRKSGQTQHKPLTYAKTETGAGIGTETCLAWTYTQLHRGALRVAGGLLASGAKGNGTGTMLLLIPNSVEYTVLLWMAVILRLTIVPLDLSFLTPERHNDLREMLCLLKPSVIVVQGAQDTETLDVAMRDLPRDTSSKRILGITLAETKHDLDLGFQRKSIWRSLLSYAASSTLSATGTVSLLTTARSDDPDRTFSILFTSGTEGEPKGCPIRVSGVAHVLQSQSWLLTPPNPPSSTTTPSPTAPRSQSNPIVALQQAHNARGIAQAQTLQTWRSGGTVVLTGSGFNSADLVDAVEKQRVSFIVMTPAMVHGVSAELERKAKLWTVDVDVSCVKTVQVCGDAITRDVLESCGRLLLSARVVVHRGITEMGGGGAFVWSFGKAQSSTDKIMKKPPFHGEMSSVGTVAPGAVVRIWDSEGGVVTRRGEVGEVHVCCGGVIPGYLDSVSADSFYEDGRRWFDTGDVGMVDKKGIVFILGRKKDAIQVNGGVVMPAPIESVLEKFTSTRACVVNVEGPFAVLERFTGKTEAQIKRHVVRTLGNQYSLQGVVYLKSVGLKKFPVNAAHKIIRAEVEDTVSLYLSQSLA